MASSNVIRNKPGRPRIGKEIADVFAVRLPSEITKAVAGYAKREAIKSKGEAIRRLVEIGLATVATGATPSPASAAPAGGSKPTTATKAALPKKTRRPPKEPPDGKK